MKLLIALALPLALMLAGCCTTPAGPVPAPISLMQQVDVLNARARLVSGLRAPGAQVWLQYVDDAGHKQSYTVDGSLVFRQYPGATGRQVADVLLVGRFAGQDVFELGSNQAEHWMAIRMDVKKAYVGALNGPGAATIPLVAEDVAEVLAIARLYEVMAPAAGSQRVAMTVKDAPEPPTNDVYVIRTPSESPAWIERIETVNRRTGLVEMVRLFHPDGTVEAVATLGDYRAAEDAGTGSEWDVDTESHLPLLLPHKVHIDYPGRQAKLELTFGEMKLAPELLGARGSRSFAMPDFPDEGLQVINVDRPESGQK